MSKRTEGYISKADRAFLVQNAKEKWEDGYAIRQIKVMGIWVPGWLQALDWLMKIHQWVQVEFYTRDGKIVTVRAMRGALRTMEEFPDREEETE